MMSSSSSLATEQAEALVAEKRRVAGGGPQQRVELAKALLELSRALEQEDRGADAVAAAKESVSVLSADFLAKPPAFAGPMRAQMAHYVALANRTGTKPDEALLAPIAQALGEVTRVEDAEDDR